MGIKQKHYSIQKIKSLDANFNLIYGEKSNGKSYQVKHECAVLHYLETGKRFILLRRWREDISNLWIEQYFSDVDIERITKGKYNVITTYRKVIYFGNMLDTGKIIKGEKIGYVISLSTEQHMSSASFLDVDMIIYEEFMERGTYIAREPDRLMIFYNTVDRKRGTTKLFMVGNTISRVCPYLQAWGLQDIIRHQNQGEIKLITIHNEENDVKLAIEYCESSGGKTMAIGNASSMIDKGSWQTNPQPHLPKGYKEYECLYKFGFQFKGFKFLCRYLLDKNTNDTCFYICPHSKEFKKKFIVFSDEIRLTEYWQRNIYDISFKRLNKNAFNFFNNFKENKIFYSDDLCGTDFKQAIDFEIRR